jgi:hypothetical protein
MGTFALVIGLAFMAAGCALLGSDRGVVALLVTNTLDRPVDVSYVDDRAPEQEDVIWPRLDAHSAVSIMDKFRADVCMSGVLIARDAETHEELATRTGPVCVPGTWEITASPPSS